MGQTVIELIENSEGRQELWQWDLGRKVRVVPSEGITVDEVHFGNVFSGEALVVEPKVDETTGDIVANVPNILATQFFSINVYAVMLIPDGKITTERVILDVTAREKPSDYVYTETEIKNYDALEKRIKALEENGGGGGIAEEKDPTVPGWAKEPEKPKYTAEEVGAVGKEELTEAINTALAQAKESGEFNGADGKDGKDGVDGKDGADGYTPQKGIDYFDGKDGLNGKDGYTPLKGTDYFTEADKQEIVQSVFAQVVNGNEVAY